MKMQLCKVIRGPMEAIVKQVPPWEVPILEAMYGAEQVIATEPENAPDVPEVEPISEYERLERFYGNHPDSGMPWVHLVYGRFEEGRFEKALAAANGPGQVAAAGAAAGEPGPAPDLEGMTKAQLLDFLAGHGVSVPPQTKKAELLDLARQVAAAA